MKKCGLCGLKLKIHSDSKCIEVLRLDREALRLALQEMVSAVKIAEQTLRWVGERGAHDVLKNNPDPLYSKGLR